METKIGIAVIVKSKEEFDAVKDFLTSDVLYLDWHENMLTQDTAVVLKANKNSDFSSGGVGGAKYMESCGIKTVPFSNNLIQYIL